MRRAVAGLIAVLVLSGAGCSPDAPTPGRAGAGATTAAATPSPSTTPPPQPARFAVSPRNGAKDVLPSKPVTVRALEGTVERVTVKGDDGHVVAGRLRDGVWTATSRPRPDERYTVRVVGTGPDGTPTTTASRFRTHRPRVTATYHVVYDGATVGIGMPVSIQFDSAVATRTMRAEVERRVSVETSPKTTGAWGWLDNRQLMWRPRTYWKPGTTVRVEAALTGVQTGADKWVAADVSGGFRVGRSMVSTVDIRRHVMTVRQNGKVVRTIPVSTGKRGPKTETRSGTKVIIGKEGEVTMDSTTVGIPKGDPDYYRIDTKWNLRVTWTGEYLHSAPWSVSAQGTANVSHGCTNMSPSNAAWMFRNSAVGDVVRFTGSSREFLPAEGIGVWQHSWTSWKAQSALR